MVVISMTPRGRWMPSTSVETYRLAIEIFNSTRKVHMCYLIVVVQAEVHGKLYGMLGKMIMFYKENHGKNSLFSEMTDYFSVIF